MGRGRARVFVTGIGLVTPLGSCAKSTWRALKRNESGIRRVDYGSQIPIKLGAVVDRTHLPSVPSFLTQTPDNCKFALVAAEEALRDAGLLDGENRYTGHGAETGVSIGVGMGGVKELYEASVQIHNQKYRKVSPALIPRLLPNTAGALVALRYGLKGPLLAPSTACAAGGHAIGDGLHSIWRDEAQVMLVGGSESCMHAIAVAGFARARALASGWEGREGESCRPFDENRGGFVIGEGAGIMVLEREDRCRGRRVYAEVGGFGMSGDAFHVTAPHEGGEGAIRAMQMALRAAGRDGSEVDYVNAHATGTKGGDLVERRAIAEVVAGGCVSSTKGATGHLLGAAGGVEAAFVAMGICDEAPGGRNLGRVEWDQFCVERGWGETERYRGGGRVEVGLSNSFGFGGVNACVCLVEARGYEKKIVV